ncbi:MAG: response regulator transcription factor [Deltaproteobacteria bacterium]|nr:response regulator transcription factor [Deltaproteobacteria bacterium]
MLKVFLADDHSVVREGLKRILTDEFKMVAYGEAENGAEVMELVRKQYWDFLILDITMPGRSGFDLLPDLREERPDLPVLVLSMHSEDQFALRVLKAGASGYITKGKAPREVLSAVKRILEGGKYVSPSFAQRMVVDLATGGEQPQHGNLSQREFQVLRMIASGDTLTEIAGTLSLSVKSISTYRARLLDKLELRSNAELTEYALEHGIV